MFAQETSLSGQFAQQWKRRVFSQEDAPTEAADRKLRRPVAHNRSPNSADVTDGDSVHVSKAVNRKSAPRRRGPAAILEIDETGATDKFQTKTFDMAPRCVRRQVDPKGVSDVSWNPASENAGALDGMPSVSSGKTIGNGRPLQEEGGDPIGGTQAFS